MQIDISKKIYEKYICLTNKNITVTLKNGKKMDGQFIAFSFGDQLCNEPFIYRWHMLAEDDKAGLGIDHFGFLIGEYVYQHDIQEILFHQDQSTL